MKYRSCIDKIKLAVAAAAIMALAPAASFAGTVILSSTIYAGAAVSVDFAGPATALPGTGVYHLDMVAVTSGTADSWGLNLYVQQQGVAGGQFYTIFNSTFSVCNNNCTRFAVPDIYLGGKLRAVWTIDSGSVTVTVTARRVSP